jgi:hypothetical protein
VIPVYLALLSAGAVAGTPVTLTGALGGAAGPPSWGGYGSGALALNLGRSALVLGGREGVLSGSLRSVGAVQVQGRYFASPSLYVQGGFFHFHETPIDVLADTPVLAVLGSAAGITHRSGLGGGVGLDLPLEDVLEGRLGAVLEVSLCGFPDPGGPPLYALVDLGFSVDVGPQRE